MFIYACFIVPMDLDINSTPTWSNGDVVVGEFLHVGEYGDLKVHVSRKQMENQLDFKVTWIRKITY